MYIGRSAAQTVLVRSRCSSGEPKSCRTHVLSATVTPECKLLYFLAGRDGQEDVTAKAWFWIGVAVRTALGLGMHRDADKSTIVPHNK